MIPALLAFTGDELSFSKLPLLLFKVALVAIVTLALRSGFWIVNTVLIKPLSDPLRHIPGPDGAPFQTHLREVMEYALSILYY